MWRRLVPGTLPVIAAALLGPLGGCAGSSAAGVTGDGGQGELRATPAQREALARYRAYAGAPVASFTWLGPLYSWEALGADRLVVFTSPSDAYLLKVWSTCDLRWVIGPIGITDTAGTVNAHLDAVTLSSSAAGPLRCPIDEIRPVDYSRMLAQIRARQAGPAATDTTTAPVK